MSAVIQSGVFYRKLIKAQDLVNRLLHESLGDDLVDTSNPDWEEVSLRRVRGITGARQGKITTEKGVYYLSVERKNGNFGLGAKLVSQSSPWPVVSGRF